MPVAVTSAIAYREHQDSGKLNRQHKQILAKMQPGHAYSRRELAEQTRLELSSICGRVNELLAIGMDAWPDHQANHPICDVAKKGEQK